MTNLTTEITNTENEHDLENDLENDFFLRSNGREVLLEISANLQQMLQDF